MVESNSLKERFLEKYPEDTRKNMRRILYSNIAITMEKTLNKDLYEFNAEEILVVIGDVSGVGLYSETAGDLRKSVISNYIDFAISEGYLTTGINFARQITPEEIRGVVSKKALENKHITRQELFEISESLNNAVDAAFIMLLFEGVRGKGMSEVTHLKRGDVDYENYTIKLHGRNEIKKIMPETASVLLEASKQTEYLVIFDTNKRQTEFTKQLQDTDYIIRSIGRSKSNSPVSHRTLLAKLRSIKQELGNPFLTVSSIWESGIIDYAKRMMEKHDITELTTEHYKKISRWAGRSEVSWFSTKALLSKYL